MISHTAISGNRSVSEETADHTGTVFLIKCDFQLQDQTPGRRIREAISCGLCPVCSVFHVCHTPFTGLTEKYADFDFCNQIIKNAY